MALTAFAGSVFATETTTAASGGAPPADAAAAASKVAASTAALEAEAKELDRADAGLDASKAAAAVDPDHLLSTAEMDAMMKDAGFTLNKETGLYDPPAGVDKSQLSRQMLLPESGADHAAFANMLLDQQHKFIQVEHGQFSLPAGELVFFFGVERERESVVVGFFFHFFRRKNTFLLLAFSLEKDAFISLARLISLLFALSGPRGREIKKAPFVLDSNKKKS